MYKIIEQIIAKINSRYHQKKIFNYLNKLNIRVTFDIGAHKGEFIDSILRLKNLKKIHAFEPQVAIFKKLKLSYSKNNKIILNNFALGNKQSKEILNINKLTSASSLKKFNNKSLWYNFRNLVIFEKNSVIAKNYVFVKKLDNYCSKNNIHFIDLLKIDVEGYELEVLKGSTKILKKTKYLLIEITRTKTYKNYDISLIEKFLKKNNFTMLQKFIFPLRNFEDRIYINLNQN